MQAQAPAALNFLHELPKGLPSFPIFFYLAQHHLFVNPQSIRWASQPGFMNLLSILISYVTFLHGYQFSIRLGWNTYFQDPLHCTSDWPVMLREGELCSHHIIGRRTHELSSDIKIFFFFKIGFFFSRDQTPHGNLAQCQNTLRPVWKISKHGV